VLADAHGAQAAGIRQHDVALDEGGEEHASDAGRVTVDPFQSRGLGELFGSTVIETFGTPGWIN